ncbi:MAG: hypothetical protein ACYCYK_09685, partial [Candidatus Dormibacteria bacterium]
DLVDRELGRFLAHRSQGMAVAVDGKAVRGAVGKDGKQVHLLGALVHKQGVLIGQRQVDGETNETTEVKPLLEPLDLGGWCQTATPTVAERKGYRTRESTCLDRSWEEG